MPSLRTGSIVAMRYRILTLLGKGGMGSVYHAEHTGLGRPVALKILELESKEAARRFEREARTAARLDHPGCVRVLDYGQTGDGTLYLAMELCDGPTLGAVLAREGRLAVGRAV